MVGGQLIHRYWGRPRYTFGGEEAFQRRPKLVKHYKQHWECDHFIILCRWKTHVISSAIILSAECHVFHWASNSLLTACHLCHQASNSLLKRYRGHSFLKQFFVEPSGVWVALPSLHKSVVVSVEGGQVVQRCIRRKCIHMSPETA